MKFKVTFRRTVVTTCVEGEFELEVSAPTPEHAQAFVEDRLPPKQVVITRALGPAKKTTEVLGANDSKTKNVVRRVERISE
jgi:hypothetical protein